jgi:hypothetical protein
LVFSGRKYKIGENLNHLEDIFKYFVGGKAAKKKAAKQKPNVREKARRNQL